MKIFYFITLHMKLHSVKKLYVSFLIKQIDILENMIVLNICSQVSKNRVVMIRECGGIENFLETNKRGGDWKIWESYVCWFRRKQLVFCDKRKLFLNVQNICMTNQFHVRFTISNTVYKTIKLGLH